MASKREKTPLDSRSFLESLRGNRTWWESLSREQRRVLLELREDFDSPAGVVVKSKLTLAKKLIGMYPEFGGSRHQYVRFLSHEGMYPAE